jgi:hypothetical protein
MRVDAALFVSRNKKMHEIEHRIPVAIEVRERAPGTESEDEDQGEDRGEQARFEFTAEASNNSLDFYFTHMLESTLRNFAAEARAGVQFLDSHNSGNLGYGRTFAGRVETLADRQPDWATDRASELAIEPPAEYLRALIDVFTIPGLRFGGGLTFASTDDFIRAVRAGLARDVSVGFYGGEWRCDICGGNYRSYQECQHFAGATYAVGERGDRNVLATVSIDGAHLAELSAVFDGATPGAMVRKAERAARAGEIEPETKRLLEARYRVELPARVVSAGVDLSGRGLARGAREAAGGKHMDIETLFNDARAAVSEVMTDEMEPGAAIRHLASEITRLQADVERLTPLADDGRAYRDDLVADALAEGVRAYGEDFAEETYRGVLESAPLETVKRMRADWARTAESRFAGRRQTVDEEEEAGATEERQVVPDAAYAA